MFTIVRNIREASRQRRAPLPQSLFTQLIELLEAEIHYNQVLVEFLDDKEIPTVAKMPTIRKEFGVAIDEPGIEDGLKRDATKDIHFFTNFFKRFKTEANQQKVLDDLFEELRFSISNINSRIELIGDDLGTTLKSYTKQKLTKPLVDITLLIAPHISNFARAFAKYNSLHFNPTSSRTGYKADSSYHEFIEAELSRLEATYKSNQDVEGIQDIQHRKGILSNKVSCVMEISLFLMEQNASMDEARLQREYSYFLFELVEQAKRVQQNRAHLSFSSTTTVDTAKTMGALASTPSQNEQIVSVTALFSVAKDKEPSLVASQTADSDGVLTTPKMDSSLEREKEATTTTPTTLATASIVSAEALKPTSTTKGNAAPIKQQELKLQAEDVAKKPHSISIGGPDVKPTVPSVPTGTGSKTVSVGITKSSPSASGSDKGSTVKQELKSKAETVTQQLTAASKGKNVPPHNVPAKKLTFSKAADGKESSTSATTDFKEKGPAPDTTVQKIPKQTLKQLEKKRYLTPLVELFYGDLKKVRIEEATLQAILQLVGGKADNNREAVRRKLSFKDRLGFVPNADNPNIEAHYHTTNGRFATPGVLAHYRDFFHRIHMAPYQLWPESYKTVDYRPTKTTRVYTHSAV